VGPIISADAGIIFVNSKSCKEGKDRRKTKRRVAMLYLLA